MMLYQNLLSKKLHPPSYTIVHLQNTQFTEISGSSLKDFFFISANKK